MVVIDASVVYKWFAQEESGSQIALKILENHNSGREVIVIPDILLYEITNALTTKVKIAFSEIKAYLKKLEEMRLQIVEFDYNLMIKNAKFSGIYQVTVYDASYAVLAKEKKCNLITADEKFIAKVNLPFIKHLSAWN